MSIRDNPKAYLEKKEELEKKKEELPIWLKEQLIPLEDKKKEKFEKVDIYFCDWNNVLIESVCE
ncbi:MAG: hypothetical protein K6E76_07460 [Patescibacteria group bacterium]|nr:hypothetical protein [Patescibacteria group bacterium]